MAKCLIDSRYDLLVVDSDDAIKLAGIYARAERVRRIYVDGMYQYFIYPQDEKTFAFEVLPDALYALGKVAGKPEKE